MTIQTWDPNRVGGGTIELIQDPTTGVFTTNEVGFVKLPDLNLPEITQADYATTSGDDDSDDSTTDPCPDGYSLVNGTCQPTGTSLGGGGGGGYEQDYTGQTVYDEALGGTYYDTRTKEMLEKAGGTYPGGYHSAEGGFEYTGTPTTFAGKDTGIKVKNIGNNPEQNSALISYNQSLKVYNDAIAKADRSNPNEMKNVDFAKNLVDTNRKNYEASIAPGGLFFEGTIKDAPIGDFSQGPRTVPTGKGTLVGDQFFADALTTPNLELKGVKEVEKHLITTKLKDILKTNVTELVEKGKKSLKIVPITAKIIGGAIDALFGVTDADRRRQTENKNALTSLGYKTRGELGSNIDPGRVAGDPSTNVFAGMNMVSAKGDIMQGARNRVSTRNSAKTQARINKLSPERQKAFNDKTKEYEKQINTAQAKKNQQAGNGGGNGGNGGNSGNSGNSGGGAGGGWGDMSYMI
jgi:hypothetical protein